MITNNLIIGLIAAIFGAMSGILAAYLKFHIANRTITVSVEEKLRKSLMDERNSLLKRIDDMQKRIDSLEKEIEDIRDGKQRQIDTLNRDLNKTAAINFIMEREISKLTVTNVALEKENTRLKEAIAIRGSKA